MASLLTLACWLVPLASYGSEVVQVATGGGHSCAVTRTGGVKCWGFNSFHQLGDGSTEARLVATDVIGLANGVKQVTAGELHTCAVTSVGGLQCWGQASQGQIGLGSRAVDVPAPADVEGLQTGVVEASAGNEHTCALTSGGAVMCWGNNFFGQLGDGTTTTRLAPVGVVGLESGVAAISAGRWHTCALTKQGRIKCWGDNSFGQLGDGTTVQRNSPVDVIGFETDGAAVVAGASHTCARTTSGAVRCWGRNDYRQVGDGTTTDRSTPVPVAGLTGGVVEIAAGSFHSCALSSTGSLRCWGDNSWAELGDGTTSERTEPVQVIDLVDGIVGLDAGSLTTCAWTSAGSVQCWGANVDGELGNGSSSQRPTPVQVQGLTAGVRTLALGSDHSCALTTSGAVKCWGSNFAGQLADGTTVDRLTPVDATDVDAIVVEIAAYRTRNCVLLNPAGAACWGIELPVQPVAEVPVDARRLLFGELHRCILTASGGVKCWGPNSDGQIGDGSTSFRSNPTDALGLTSGVKAIAVGLAHTCAITSSSGLRCWGRNFSGQVGAGSSSRQLVPVDVDGLASNVAAVAAGDDHSCAVTTAGAVKCWGRNVDGQLGDGTLIDSRTPVAVSGLSGDVIAVAAARKHTCALTRTGQVKCWGANSRGQLGDGTRINRIAPVNVIGLPPIASIAVGENHSCALTAVGAVWCWGENDYGQIGNGEARYSAFPTGVIGISGMCGDGIVQRDEACDDGDPLDTGCCSAGCRLQNVTSDVDLDGICAAEDNCTRDYNPDQRNSDESGRGDICDICPSQSANACDPERSTAATITSEGGIVTVPDGSIELEVSPGALPGPRSVSITGGLAESSYGLKTSDATLLVAQLEPSGVQFDPPILITLRWADINDNCFVDDPAKTCPTTTRAVGVPCPPVPADCDLNVNESKDLQIWRNGREYPTPGVYCGNDQVVPPNDLVGCDTASNSWTVPLSEFSEYVLGAATCVAMTNAGLEVRNLLSDAGDEKVSFRGGFNVDVPIEPALDLRTTGLTISVVTTDGKPVLVTEIAGGAYDPNSKVGWKKAPDRPTWTYKGKPPGVKTAKVSLVDAVAGRVKVTFVARSLTAPTLEAHDLPLRARLFVGGRCGDALFAKAAPDPSCRFAVDLQRVVCD